jgi:hypothetical protein
VELDPSGFYTPQEAVKIVRETASFLPTKSDRAGGRFWARLFGRSSA